MSNFEAHITIEIDDAAYVKSLGHKVLLIENIKKDNTVYFDVMTEHTIKNVTDSEAIRKAQEIAYSFGVPVVRIKVERLFPITGSCLYPEQHIVSDHPIPGTLVSRNARTGGMMYTRRSYDPRPPQVRKFIQEEIIFDDNPEHDAEWMK